MNIKEVENNKKIDQNDNTSVLRDDSSMNTLDREDQQSWKGESKVCIAQVSAKILEEMREER